MQASRGSAWNRSPMRERLAWVSRFRRLVAGRESRLRELIVSETCKPEFEALTGDIWPLVAACRFVERRGAGILRERRVRGGGLLGFGVRARVRREPLGHVAIIATWNYPVQLLGVQLVQALAAANTVVVKPSEHTPRTQGYLLDLALEAGLPEGTLSRTPATREAGRELIAGGRWGRPDHVVFTGSTGVGTQIARQLAETLTSSTLELSGRDSAFVLSDADVQIAAASIWAGIAMNGGQTCMAPRRVLVERGVYGKFLAALAPLAAGAKAVRLIDAAAAERCAGLAQAAVKAGGRSLSGVLSAAAGRMITPMVIADCPAGAELVRGEHFGPVAAVVPVASVEEAIEIHLSQGQHLVTSVFSGSRSRAEALAARVGSTTVTINACTLPTAHPGVSLAGTGESGWGLTRGAEGLLGMTRPVYITATSVRMRPSLDPQPGAFVERFARFVRGWYGGGWGAASPARRAEDSTNRTEPAAAGGE